MEAGGTDSLLFGDDITPGMARLERRHNDLVVNLAGPHGRVTAKDWFASDSKKIEIIRFADGTTWGVEEIRDRARRGGHGGGWHGDDHHGYHHSNHDDDHHGKGDGRKHNDGDGNRSERESDGMADLLAAYFADKPRYDFEAFAQELETSNGYGEAPGHREIARRWHLVARYGAGLANEHDDEGRSGAVFRLDAYGLFRGVSLSGGFGYSASTGATRGTANMRTLEGLEDGFQRLSF